MIRAITFVLALSCVASAADDKRAEELKKKISEKRAELDKLEKELGKIESEQAVGLNEWSQVGDVRIRITKVKIQKPELLFQGEKGIAKAKELELVIWIEVENTSPVKKIRYDTYQSDIFSKVIARDEHKNTYIAQGRGYSTTIDGSAKRHEMRPGDPAFVDVIAIERPVDAAKELTLELDSQQSDEKGKHRFKFTSAAWKEAKK